MKRETVYIKDIRFMAFVSFMLSLLAVEVMLFPNFPFNAISIGIIVFWNAMVLFVYLRRKSAIWITEVPVEEKA